jgi:hypothetical protein
LYLKELDEEDSTTAKKIVEQTRNQRKGIKRDGFEGKEG